MPYLNANKELKRGTLVSTLNLAGDQTRTRMRRYQKAIEPTEAMLAAKPMDTIREVCRVILDSTVNQDTQDLYRLGLAYATKFPTITTTIVRRNNRLAADLEGMIQRAQRDGAFSGRDPAMIATFLIGAFISNPINRTALSDAQFHDPVGRRRYFDGMWGFVRDVA